MTQSPLVFIFIGKSGSGKGTQVEKLIEYLKKHDSSREIVYLQTGKIFREFIAGDSFTQKESKKLYMSGALQPEFLAINMWSNFFVREMKPNAHVFIDGTPRKFQEAATLDSTIKFYRWHRPHVIFLTVSHQEAIDRLLKRGRMDDKEDDIKSRLNWFETDVMKAVEYYRENSGYWFHEINGQQDIESVHAEILRSIGLPE